MASIVVGYQVVGVQGASRIVAPMKRSTCRSIQVVKPEQNPAYAQDISHSQSWSLRRRLFTLTVASQQAVVGIMQHDQAKR